jgi:hypothetical protein
MSEDRTKRNLELNVSLSEAGPRLTIEGLG